MKQRISWLILMFVVALFSVMIYLSNTNKPTSVSAVSVDMTNAKPIDQNRVLSAEKEKEMVDKAYSQASSVMEIKNRDNYGVSYKGDVIIVTWPYVHNDKSGRPVPPGPDYVARVKVNKNTGEIIEILGAQ